MLLETHPFESFVPQGAKILILGTFPPEARYRNFKFYYPNSVGNRFWRIMEYVFSCKFLYWEGDAAVEERKALFEKERIGLTDMVEKCVRSGSNSSDKNLSKIEFRNVYELLKNNSTIQKIILTSRTDGSSEQIHRRHLSKSRNNSALELLNEHLMENGIIIQNLRRQEDIIRGEFELDNRIIKIFIPYTPVARWYNNHKSKVNYMYKCSLKE